MKNGDPIEVRTTNEEGPTSSAHASVERTNDRKVYTPPTDILETNEAFVLTVDVPGADPDTLDVTYENDVLTIRASCAAHEPEGHALAHAEYEFGDYQRAFEIGQRLNADAIQADLKDGVLTIRLPKAAPSRRKVAITTG